MQRSNDAICSAMLLQDVYPPVCPFVCLSVCHAPVKCQNN